MITKERLTEIIDDLVAWGLDHSEDFYDCLMNAAGMTDEELAELGFVYNYDGEEIENLVELQEKLEKENTRITSPAEVLVFCKENNIDTYAAFVMGACEDAYSGLKESSKKKVSFNNFCHACDEILLDWSGDNKPGLTDIAERVKEYYEEHKKLPCHAWDLDEGYEGD